jgi:hypothetical protein
MIPVSVMADDAMGMVFAVLISFAKIMYAEKKREKKMGGEGLRNMVGCCCVSRGLCLLLPLVVRAFFFLCFSPSSVVAC